MQPLNWYTIEERYPLSFQAMKAFIDRYLFHHTLDPNTEYDIAGPNTDGCNQLYMYFENIDCGPFSIDHLPHFFDSIGKGLFIEINCPYLPAHNNKWAYTIMDENSNSTMKSSRQYNDRYQALEMAVMSCFNESEKLLKKFNPHILN